MFSSRIALMVDFCSLRGELFQYTAHAATVGLLIQAFKKENYGYRQQCVVTPPSMVEGGHRGLQRQRELLLDETPRIRLNIPMCIAR